MDSRDAHRQALLDRHDEIDILIEEENKRPHPDDLLLSRLKKQKLRFKDEADQMKSVG